MTIKIKKGIYRHFKGKNYKVLGLARHSETLEQLVVYKALYGKKELWVRPAKMFLAKTVRRPANCSPEHSQDECLREKVSIDGKKVPRFKFIK